MMLFLVGLELDPKTLWAMRAKLLGFGSFQVAGTTLVVMAFGIWHVVWSGVERRTGCRLGFLIVINRHSAANSNRKRPNEGRWWAK